MYSGVFSDVYCQSTGIAQFHLQPEIILFIITHTYSARSSHVIYFYGSDVFLFFFAASDPRLNIMLDFLDDSGVNFFFGVDNNKSKKYKKTV